MPSSRAMRETRPLSFFGTSSSQAVSFLRWITRRAFTPQSWPSPDGKRSCAKGSRSSSDQPSESRVTADSQTASQLTSSKLSS